MDINLETAGSHPQQEAAGKLFSVDDNIWIELKDESEAEVGLTQMSPTEWDWLCMIWLKESSETHYDLTFPFFQSQKLRKVFRRKLFGLVSGYVMSNNIIWLNLYCL